MLEHKKIQNLSDFFTELGKRREKGVYFYRIRLFRMKLGNFYMTIMMREEVWSDHRG